MKTLVLNPFMLVRSFFASLKQEQLTGSANTKVINNHTLGKEQEAGNSKPDMNEFQRKAHAGNFFAGPHCVFNPGLF